ncbi:Hypothetical protein D9617_9g025490 [Elsinoe fawcettii]|nr:Hypothetical protein D9617_9g025490 [Elsinoe fawcettii]
MPASPSGKPTSKLLLRPSKPSSNTARSSTQPSSSAGDLQITPAPRSVPSDSTVTYDSSQTPLYFLDDEALKRRQTHYKCT